MDKFGEPVVGAPQEIMVRWEETSQELRTATGQVITILALLVLGQRVNQGDILWKGTLANLPTGTSFLGEQDNLMQVVSYESIPDVKGRFYERTAKLARYRGTLPNLS